MKSAAFESISLDLLKTFITFVETEGVEEAAQKLDITQASVSLQLQKLEDQLGLPLFRRVGRRKLLTDLAKQLSQDLVPPLKLVSQVLRETTSRKVSVRAQSLRLSCSPYFFSRVFSLLKLDMPLRFVDLDTEAAFKAMAEDRIDCALMADTHLPDGFKKKSLFEDAFVLAWPAKFAIHAGKNVLQRLLELPMAKNQELEPELLKLFGHYDMTTDDLRAPFEGENQSSVLSLLKQGVAWSLVSEAYAEAFEGSKQTVPAEILRPVNYSMVWHESKKLPAIWK